MKSKACEYSTRYQKKRLFAKKSVLQKKDFARLVGEKILAAMKIGQTDLKVEGLLFMVIQS